eukprot:GGOE01040866.1.p1 GENE.GGOE01040866.1~~GGOE01040866.1.p1  ORF type:complete len:712 (+),score=117.65 GGOE01040866.1:87-2222(+)
MADRQVTPHCGDDCQALVLHSGDGCWYLLASGTTGWTAARLEPEAGTLTCLFGPEPFPTLHVARQALHSSIAEPLTLHHAAMGIGGCCTVRTTTFLLCIDKATVAVTLPVRGGEIYRVKESRWIALTSATSTVSNEGDTTEEERSAAEALLGMSVDETHFFAWTLDLTAPLPHGLHRDRLSPWAEEFDWNAALRRPFREAGLEEVCMVLLRGYAGGEHLQPMPTGGDPQRLSLALLCRQDRRNSAPRVPGRGLNAAGHPGNEFECELFLWWAPGGSPTGRTTADPRPERFQWARHIWRRGTVPLSFNYSGAAQFYSPLGPPLDARSMAATPQYFGALTDHLQRIAASDSSGDSADSIVVEVVDLLSRTWPHEERISHRYEEAVQHAAASPVQVPLRFVHFDWHAASRRLGVLGAVEDVWRCLRPPLEDGCPAVSSGEFSGDEPVLIRVTSRTTQQEFRRFNCADSLDRTNLVSFFTTLRLVATPHPGGPLPPTQSTCCESKAQQRDCSLRWCDISCPSRTVRQPAGLHVALPPSASACGALDCVLHTIHPHLLRALAQLFLESGDSISQIFTGSVAMHSDVIRDLCPDLAGLQLNMLIGIQRGFRNLFRDDKKAQESLLLLGQHPCQRAPLRKEARAVRIDDPPGAPHTPIELVHPRGSPGDGETPKGTGILKGKRLCATGVPAAPGKATALPLLCAGPAARSTASENAPV